MVKDQSVFVSQYSTVTIMVFKDTVVTVVVHFFRTVDAN